MLDLQKLLEYMVEQRGSDLHIKVGSPPHVRVDGHLAATEFKAVLPADTERIVAAILAKDRAEEFRATSEADFAYSVSGLGRFRVNAFRQRGSVGLVFRRILPGAPSFEGLGLPGVVSRLADEPSGLVLVAGSIGSGRTTTLASMIDHINETRAVNIVTIEDPIEVLHSDKMAIVNQRELGTDTRDYPEAMRRALRQDPDVIFVGELHDHETALAVLRAAESGQLVLGALQANNATESINRMVEFFAPFQAAQIRQTLANTLRGVVVQRLIERADGTGRVPAVEALVTTGRIADRIIDPEGRETIEDVMIDGEYYGMQTFDQSLFGLCKNGLVSVRDAMMAASYPDQFKLSLETAGLVSRG
jgi:twitching motility protein PilT